MEGGRSSLLTGVVNEKLDSGMLLEFQRAVSIGKGIRFFTFFGDGEEDEQD